MKKKLRVKTVRYARLKNLGNYENERLEIEVEIDPGEDVDAQLRGAKRWVTKRLRTIESDVMLSGRKRHDAVCICDECM